MNVLSDSETDDLLFHKRKAFIPCILLSCQLMRFHAFMYSCLMTLPFFRSADFLPFFAGVSNSTLVLTFPVFLSFLVCVPCTMSLSPSYRTMLPSFNCVLCLRTETRPFFTLWPRAVMSLVSFLLAGIGLRPPQPCKDEKILTHLRFLPRRAFSPRQCYPAV